VYPLKFENLYYEKIWGGRDFELFRDNLPNGNIGESWDIAFHPHGTSVVANGEFRGMSLAVLLKLKGAEIVGTEIPKDWFPLLIKLINAKDNLSIQVHPNDEYAKMVEGEMGKTEVWYVIEAFQDAHLVVGTKGNCTREEFKLAIDNGTLDKYINKVSVKKGDVYFIQSGLIHAIGAGVIIAEIQQNSDITYRVYDYNRGRELHIEKALDVIDFAIKGEKIEGITLYKGGYSKTQLCLDKDFSLELYNIQDSFTENSDKERFYTFTCVEGNGELIYKDGKENIKTGDSFLIPASLGEYSFIGTMKVLKSYVPNL
jgi:mannose-6-phosphate isomerase